MSEARLQDTIGICPGCEMPGPVARSCSTAACNERALCYLPVAHAAGAIGVDDDPLVGRRFEDTLVVARLGVGGFGKVYLALSLKDGQPVALKVANAVGTPDEAIARDRLTIEARALGRLSHSNVVRLVRSSTFQRAPEAEPTPYFMMEYVAGKTSLADLLADHAVRGTLLGPRLMGSLLRQLLDALAAVHARGIVHRDVKPANILLAAGDPPEVKLFDFGLAKFMGRRQPPSLIVGTPSHMAPEQFDGQGIGPWTDLYAVGVIAWEMLIGRDPFAGVSSQSVIDQRRDTSLGPLEALREDGALSVPWRIFLERALAPDPEDRFESAEDMRAALDVLLVERPSAPVAVPVELPPEDLGPPPKRRDRRLILGVAGAVVIGLAAFAIAGSGGSGAPAAPPPPDHDPAPAPTELAASAPPPLALTNVAPDPAPPPADDDGARAAARSALVGRVASCEATPDELAQLDEICSADPGCTTLKVAGDLTRWVELPAPQQARSVVVELAPPSFEDPAQCGGSWRRSQALVDGSWDSLPPGHGGYARPRVALELRFADGDRRSLTHWLTERAARKSDMDALQRAVEAARTLCLTSGDLGRDRTPSALRTWEQRAFYGTGIGFTGEVGRTPCRLELLRVHVLAGHDDGQSL